MPLLLSGQKFRTDLESFGCLAILSPLEGGAETRLLRRLRASGYQTQITSARGLGDPLVFLTQFINNLKTEVICCSHVAIGISHLHRINGKLACFREIEVIIKGSGGVRPQLC